MSTTPNLPWAEAAPAHVQSKTPARNRSPAHSRTARGRTFDA